MRNAALWLHIIGASMWLGTNLAQLFIGPKLVNGGAGAQWLKAVEKAGGPIYGAASGLILLTGIYLVLSNDAFSFGSAFVGIGIAVVIIGGAMAGLVFNRKTRQAIGLFESGDTARAMPIYKSIASWGMFDTALLALTVLAMVSKWGA
ncbi:MAG TPA: hypothetical protein VJQ79_02680 [Acidimicrobiia bacterium]|nr:hypothetical protein [Acidimicrobiia bacterium]